MRTVVEPKTDGNKPEAETQQTGKDQCDQSDYYVGEIVTLESDQSDHRPDEQPCEQVQCDQSGYRPGEQFKQDQCDPSDYRPEEKAEQDQCDHCDHQPEEEIDWGLILDPGGSWQGVHMY